MGARFYDNAILNKLKNWVKDPNIKITGPEETRRLFEYIADVTNDKAIELPLIALRRQPTLVINNANKQPLTFDGQTIEGNSNTKKVGTLLAIPITLNYNIDIYTRYFDEADEYVRNFVFNLINYPKVKVNIPYNGSELEHYANITLNPEVQDNSDIPERLIAGQFTRWTISIEVNDAYLFNYKIDDTWNIETDLQVKLSENIKLKYGEEK